MANRSIQAVRSLSLRIGSCTLGRLGDWGFFSSRRSWMSCTTPAREGSTSSE